MKRYFLFFVLTCLLFFKSADSQTTTQRNTGQTNTQKKTLSPKPSTQKKTTAQPNKTTNPEIRWHGTITVIEKFSGLTGRSERYISLFFDNALPTLYRNIETTDLNFTDDKGSGKVSEYSEFTIRTKDEKTGIESEKVMGRCDCIGNGQSELHEVVIDRIEQNYRIHAVPPPCKGGNLGGDGCGGDSWDIIISDKRLGTDHFLLSGNETTERDLTIGKVTTTTTWNLTGCPAWSDPQTRLRAVDTRVRAAANRFIKRAHDELCLKLKVASGFRTFEEQDKLYAIGRPPPPIKKVTKSRGGESYHNYGLAVDIYIVQDNGLLDLEAIIPPEAIKIAKEEGFAWGGDWENFKDYPHFEMTFGKTTKQLKEGK